MPLLQYQISKFKSFMVFLPAIVIVSTGYQKNVWLKINIIYRDVKEKFSLAEEFRSWDFTMVTPRQYFLPISFPLYIFFTDY